MPNRARTKVAFHRTMVREPIAASELDAADRILARLVALAYVGDHPDLFTAGPVEQSDTPILFSSGVPLVARTVPATEAVQYE